VALPATAVAGQPPPADLNPPPPAFYTCMATGEQTICQGTRELVEDPVDIGIVCGSGAAAFDIYDQGVVDDRATRYYNADRNLTRRVVQERWTSSFWSNPITGATVPYTQRAAITDVFALPGDLSSATETIVGENIYTGPITGKKVLRSTGRQVAAPDGTVEFSAGQQPFIDAMVFGDLSVFNNICAALSR
jgi:hypothetical protein